MAKLHQIHCVVRANRANPYERILSIGGLHPHGSRWMISQQEAIDALESGRVGFYVEVEGRRVPVVVAVSEDGHRYLKTEADGVQPGQLLALPECRRIN